MPDTIDGGGGLNEEPIMTSEEAQAFLSKPFKYPPHLPKVIGASNIARFEEIMCDPVMMDLDFLLLTGEVDLDQLTEYTVMMSEFHSLRYAMITLAADIVTHLSSKFNSYAARTFDRDGNFVEGFDTKGIFRLLQCISDLYDVAKIPGAKLYQTARLSEFRAAGMQFFAEALMSYVADSFSGESQLKALLNVRRVLNNLVDVQSPTALVQVEIDANGRPLGLDSLSKEQYDSLCWLGNTVITSIDHASMILEKFEPAFVELGRLPAEGVETGGLRIEELNAALFRRANELSYFRKVLPVKASLSTCEVIFRGDEHSYAQARRGQVLCDVTLYFKESDGYVFESCPLDLIEDRCLDLTLDRSTGELYLKGTFMSARALFEPEAYLNFEQMIFATLAGYLMAKEDDIDPCEVDQAARTRRAARERLAETLRQGEAESGEQSSELRLVVTGGEEDVDESQVTIDVEETAPEQVEAPEEVVPEQSEATVVEFNPSFDPLAEREPTEREQANPYHYTLRDVRGISGTDALSILNQLGLQPVRVKGSHHMFIRKIETSGGPITAVASLPIHGGVDVHPPLLKSLLVRFQIPRSEFLELVGR